MCCSLCTISDMYNIYGTCNEILLMQRLWCITKYQNTKKKGKIINSPEVLLNDFILKIEKKLLLCRTLLSDDGWIHMKMRNNLKFLAENICSSLSFVWCIIKLQILDVGICWQVMKLYIPFCQLTFPWTWK